VRMFFAFAGRFRAIARQNKFGRQNILCEPRSCLYIRRLPHQARELSLLRGLKRVFLSPGVTT
ncbi:MAG TPA: hypothetical protein VHT01_09260, partial [Candidatus Udaeobacter sp.]|nr:hypothetical protein [Candidatus Udaeobacter sp.]